MKRPYAKLGNLIRRAMTNRGWTVTAFSKEIGYSPGNLSMARSGLRLPAPETIARIADALDAPGIVEAYREVRETTCGECERAFIPGARWGRARFCSRRCRQKHHSRIWSAKRRVKDDVRLRIVVLGLRSSIRGLDSEIAEQGDALAVYRAAVDAFCRSCEWSGVCRTPDCELRPVSPLPLATEAVA